MTTDDFFAYLCRNPATSDLSANLSQLLEQRTTLNRIARQAAGGRAA
jgi:hypothetical protein